MTDRSFAVVTGASSGIGRELARQFAANDFDLLICAEDDDIVAAADELRAGGAAVTVAQVDLAAPGGVDELYAAIRAAGRPVDAIALNAGIGAGGAFAGPDGDRTELDDELRLIDLNVRSTVHLAKHVRRRHGRAGRRPGALHVLDRVHDAGLVPGRLQRVEVVRAVVRAGAAQRAQGHGVTVTALMPGPTETEFFERADMLDTKVGASDKDDPADVAREGFEALMAGKERVVAGSLSTKLQGKGSRVMPDRVKAAMHRRMAEPGSGG